MNYDIIHVMDHYEAYTPEKIFICSGDTRSETEREADEILVEGR